jgi:D-glycero-D-manno-heptose 1,7-bisphosphate phosphatase
MKSSHRELSQPAPFILLDRDGVINEDSDEYIKSPEEWIPIPGSLDAIARLNRAGWRVVVVSNQSGVARRLFDIEVLMRINAKMHRLLSEIGGRIEANFFCPHGPQDGCSCRKPLPGLLRDFAERLRLDLRGVPFVGDSRRDLEAAIAVEAQPILVRTGKGARTLEKLGSPGSLPVFKNLAEVADALLVETR